MKSPWTWKQYGQSGKWVSSLLPHLATCVDDMAFVYSMVAKSNVHGPATFMQVSSTHQQSPTACRHSRAASASRGVKRWTQR